MIVKERQTLMQVLDILANVQVDTHVYAHQQQYGVVAYDYDMLGRQIMCTRKLAEFVGIPQAHMLPGEFYEDESDIPNLLMYTPAHRSLDTEPLTPEEKKWLQHELLSVMDHLSGVSDSDAALQRLDRKSVV